MKHRLGLIAFVAAVSVLLCPAIVPSNPEPVGRAIAWLTANQNPSGSWARTRRLEVLETATALDTLLSLGVSSEAVTRALTWLAAQPASNTDFVARKIVTLTVMGGKS